MKIINKLMLTELMQILTTNLVTIYMATHYLIPTHRWTAEQHNKIMQRKTKTRVRTEIPSFQCCSKTSNVKINRDIAAKFCITIYIPEISKSTSYFKFHDFFSRYGICSLPFSWVFHDCTNLAQLINHKTG